MRVGGLECTAVWVTVNDVRIFTWFRVWGLGFRVYGLGFRVKVDGSGFRDWGLGFRVWGSGFRV